MGNLAVIDGSLLAFRASAAGEKRSIEVTHRSSGHKKTFNTRTEFKKWIGQVNTKREEEDKKAFALTDFEIEDIISAPAPEISLKTLKSMLSSILSACQAEDYLIYLDEGTTFRHHLATMQEYKGNRDTIKPQNLQLVKENLVIHKNAKVINHLEADDYLNFHQYEGWLKTKSGDQDKIISVTFDKDAFGNPGWIYDFRKDDNGKPIMAAPLFIDGLGELRWLADKKEVKGTGRKFFYYQLLYGDDADTYRANKLANTRFGKKAAYETLTELQTDKACLQAIIDKYKEWYGQEFEYTSWRGDEIKGSWLSLFTEIWNLAYMRRNLNDIPNVEAILAKVGISYD